MFLYQTLGLIFRVISDNALYYYKFLLFLLALVLNIVTLFYYNYSSENFVDDLGDANTAVTVLSFINSSFSFLVLIMWSLVWFPTI